MLVAKEWREGVNYPADGWNQKGKCRDGQALLHGCQSTWLGGGKQRMSRGAFPAYGVAAPCPKVGSIWPVRSRYCYAYRFHLVGVPTGTALTAGDWSGGDEGAFADKSPPG
jgi:hypothetical protein